LNNTDDDMPKGPLGLWSFPVLSAVRRKQDADLRLTEAKARALASPKGRENDQWEDGEDHPIFPRRNHIY